LFVWADLRAVRAGVPARSTDLPPSGTMLRFPEPVLRSRVVAYYFERDGLARWLSFRHPVRQCFLLLSAYATWLLISTAYMWPIPAGSPIRIEKPLCDPIVWGMVVASVVGVLVCWRLTRAAEAFYDACSRLGWVRRPRESSDCSMQLGGGWHLYWRDRTEPLGAWTLWVGLPVAVAVGFVDTFIARATEGAWENGIERIAADSGVRWQSLASVAGLPHAAFRFVFAVLESIAVYWVVVAALIAVPLQSIVAECLAHRSVAKPLAGCVAVVERDQAMFAAAAQHALRQVAIAVCTVTLLMVGVSLSYTWIGGSEPNAISMLTMLGGVIISVLAWWVPFRRGISAARDLGHVPDGYREAWLPAVPLLAVAALVPALVGGLYMVWW
jgi:hypothetical protein